MRDMWRLNDARLRTMRRHAAVTPRCGLLLSGGLDSRILLAAARPEIEPFPTFSF